MLISGRGSSALLGFRYGSTAVDKELATGVAYIGATEPYTTRSARPSFSYGGSGNALTANLFERKHHDPSNPTAYAVGQLAGSAAGLVMDGLSVISGLATIVVGGGGGLALAVPSFGTSVAGIAVPAVATGTAMVGGGVAAGTMHVKAASQAIDSLLTFSMAARPTAVGGARGTWTITKERTSKVARHPRFGQFSKSKTDGLWWSKDRAGHGGSRWKVFEEVDGGLQWKADADEFGNFITGKHESETGQVIAWSDLGVRP